MPGSRQHPQLALVLAVSGGLVVAVTSLLGSGFAVAALPFLLWALVPWCLYYALGRWVLDAWATAGGGIALLVGELGVRSAVFLFPQGSTAAVLLVFSPVYLIVIALLPGAALGWLAGRAWRLRVWLGLGVAGVGCLLVSLLGLALARPDLAPWAVAERRGVLERVGDPRVVVATGGLERRPVTDERGWYLVAELDGESGEEIAVVDHRRILLLDPVNLEIEGRLEHGVSAGGSSWNWFTRLAFLDGRMVVVRSGGGYSETELLELDGRRIFRYRPRPELPPSALLPADLDRDGRLELYAADGSRVVRLDGAGREVWAREATYGTGLLLAPRTDGRSAWVVGSRFSGEETTYFVWDENGRELGQIVAPAGAASLVDLEDGRHLISGRSTATGIDLAGRIGITVELGDLSFSQAVSVRLEPEGPVRLGIVAAAPSDVGRWRLLLLAPPDQVLYDEIFDQPISLLRARRPDGTDLFLVQAPAGLWTLGPENSLASR